MAIIPPGFTAPSLSPAQLLNSRQQENSFDFQEFMRLFDLLEMGQKGTQTGTAPVNTDLQAFLDRIKAMPGPSIGGPGRPFFSKPIGG